MKKFFCLSIACLTCMFNIIPLKNVEALGEKNVANYDYLILTKFWIPGQYFRLDYGNFPNSKYNYYLRVLEDTKSINMKDSYYGRNLSFHGLWPSLNGKPADQQPSYCIKDPKNMDIELLPLETRRVLRESYGATVEDFFIGHEYLKHGTCYEDGSFEGYANAVVEYGKKAETPDFMVKNLGKIVKYNDLLASFGGKSGHVHLVCSSGSFLYGMPQVLIEVMTFLNKDGTPYAVADPVVNECQNSDIYIAAYGESEVVLEHISEITDSKSLHGISVGFGVDDVLFDVSQLFKEASKNYQNGSDAFFDFVNSSTELYSWVKSTTRDILLEHIKVGNKVYFITSRKCSASKSMDPLKDFILKSFPELGTSVNLICTNGDADISSYINKNGIGIYYGNRDSEMYSASKAGAQPVRIERFYKVFSSEEEGLGDYHSGIYTEKVILGSEY